MSTADLLIVDGDGNQKYLSASKDADNANSALLIHYGHALELASSHSPTSANVKATTSVTAVTGKIHVCTSISATLCQNATGGTPFQGFVSLKSAANVLARWNIAVTGSACDMASFVLSNISIPANSGEALTLDFNAAGGATVFQSVAMTYYTIAP